MIQYEEWKVRELTRLKRDAEQRELAAAEKAELMRRRNLTDEERMAEDMAAGRYKDNDAEQAGRKKWNFMQKYYHRGAFYMDQDTLKDKDDVRNKNYDQEATLEDHVSSYYFKNTPIYLKRNSVT